MNADDPSFAEEVSRKLQDMSGGEQACGQWIERLRQLWGESRNDGGPGVAPQEVFDRLERKYQPMVEAIERDQGSMAADRIRTRLAKMRSFPLTGQSDTGQSS